MTVIEYKRDGNRIYSIEAINLGIEKEKSAGQLVALDERKSPEQTPIADFYTRIEKLLSKYNNSSKIVGCVRALNKTVTHQAKKRLRKNIGEWSSCILIYFTERNPD